MKQMLLIAAVGYVLAACASTGEGAMTLAEGEKMECRSITESGTILPKRVCNNKATWAEIDERDKEAGQETMRKVQERWTPPPQRNGM